MESLTMLQKLLIYAGAAQKKVNGIHKTGVLLDKTAHVWILEGYQKNY